jgi:hypothetical protein
MHTLWKKEIVPPNNCALIVTAAAPNQTMTKTAAKTNEADSDGAVILKTMDNRRQTRSGPQRSPMQEAVIV